MTHAEHTHLSVMGFCVVNTKAKNYKCHTKVHTVTPRVLPAPILAAEGRFMTHAEHTQRTHIFQ